MVSRRFVVSVPVIERLVNPRPAPPRPARPRSVRRHLFNRPPKVPAVVLVRHPPIGRSSAVILLTHTLSIPIEYSIETPSKVRGWLHPATSSSSDGGGPAPNPRSPRSVGESDRAAAASGAYAQNLCSCARPDGELLAGDGWPCSWQHFLTWLERRRQCQECECPAHRQQPPDRVPAKKAPPRVRACVCARAMEGCPAEEQNRPKGSGKTVSSQGKAVHRQWEGKGRAATPLASWP